ncbi:MAG: DUF5715 family protein [Bacteroidales bacterium]|nr:DUF5715 family protein [Bacteroidales bacterium]
MRKTQHIISAIIIIISLASCQKEKKRITHDFELKPFPKYYLTFNDRNDKQLTVATTIGISPISTRQQALKMADKLVEIKSNEYYTVDSLRSSLPFLVNIAAARLDSIGIRFQDSLISKGAPLYKIHITSILRSKEDIDKLHKKNTNANVNSAHLYGTTFDIAYWRFERVDTTDIEIDKSKLKVVLAEVLRDMKEANKCFVKYEVKQGCFHVTARQ